MVLSVKDTRCNMMTPVPNRVKQTGIVSVVENDLVFGDLGS
jgi:hypothetical protein